MGERNGPCYLVLRLLTLQLLGTKQSFWGSYELSHSCLSFCSRIC